MTISATRFPFSALVAVALTSAAVAALALYTLASGPERLDRSPPGAPWQSGIAATPGLQPGAPPATRRAKITRIGKSSSPVVATRDDNVWLSRAHNDAHDRFEAISALGDSSDEIAEMTLVNLLYDESPAIRESAVESLASLGTHGAIQGLGLALHDADPLVRLTALELLAEIGTPDSLAAFSATLNDPDASVRLAAVYELADSEDAATSSLLQQFLADTDPAVRQLAAEFLQDASQDIFGRDFESGAVPPQ